METIKHKLQPICFETISTARHLLRRLIESPVLLAYIIVGAGVAFVQKGLLGLCFTFANLVILGLFAILICQMTINGARVLSIQRPKAELFTGLAVLILIFFLVSLAWNITHIPVLQPGMIHFIAYITKVTYYICGNGPFYWARDYIANALAVIFIELVPTLLLFGAFGYNPRGMGFRLGNAKLIIVLLSVTALAGLLDLHGTALYSNTLPHTLILFIIQFFINGLPEELFYRGYLLPRFERILKNPVNALVLSALLFNASHIPSYLANGSGWSGALLNVFSLICPTGLLYGYLYQRTRSIIPGALLHTASTNTLGWFFFSL